jgi:DNA processing protein
MDKNTIISSDPYGKSIARTIAAEFTEEGFTIVSGIACEARAIDTTGNKGSLKAEGRSIAVLDFGIYTPYPRENKSLFKELVQNSAVISEFTLGTSPNRKNFPKRNRLIRGLSPGLLIIKASAGSGSLITTHYALEQGKGNLAVP